jgi:hypothetical protein
MKTMIDVIVAWPNNCDYPLFRKFIRDNRDRFNRVFIVITEANRKENYANFLTEVMHRDDVDFIFRPTQTEKDWRDDAVNEALNRSKSQWVWFVEQDFIPADDFFSTIEAQFDQSDALAIYQEKRMHPACIFARRDIIDKTSRKFGIVPNVSDHFSIFQKEIEDNLSAKVYRIHEDLYQHLNGLSSNLTQIQDGQDPNYRPDEVAKYLKKSFESLVVMDEYWSNKMTEWFGKHSGNTVKDAGIKNDLSPTGGVVENKSVQAKK